MESRYAFASVHKCAEARFSKRLDMPPGTPVDGSELENCMQLGSFAAGDGRG